MTDGAGNPSAGAGSASPESGAVTSPDPGAGRKSPPLPDRIDDARRRSRPLEPDPHERRAVRDAVVAYAEEFLTRLPEARAYDPDRSPAARIRRFPPTEAPRPIHELLDLLREAVDGPGLNPASPHHLGYIPGGGLPTSALGDYVAAVTNHYSGIGFSGPGAVEIENQLLRWMADLVGFPEESGGTLCSGGSIGTLVAVVTAREAREVRAATIPSTVIYTTEQAHHCIEKSLGVAGLGEAVRRTVPMDASYRMDPEALRRQVRRDRRRGLRPWLVVASAGTTDVGVVDPLDAVADVAAEEDLWYHVDGAYGAFFALCPEVRPVLRGMERADSLVLDPHKGLFVPYGLGAVLVRDDEALTRAHAFDAAYLQDGIEPEDAGAGAPATRSPELSRHWRGLRLWLPLQLHGVAPFRAALEEKLLLARYFHHEAARLGFETGPEPALSLTTYRWVPPEGDADAFNRRLVQEIHRDGRTFVTSTSVRGRVFLRACILSMRTHREHVDETLGWLREKADHLSPARGGGSAPSIE